MKKGNLTGTQIIVAILTLIVIIVIVAFGSDAFAKISDSLGFGADLTAEEIAAQEQAKSQIESNFLPMIYDCKSKTKTNCFCSNNSLNLPTDYVLRFGLENGMKISLINNKGGKVEDYNLNNIQPCISDDVWNLANLNVQTKDSSASLTFGSINYLVYKNVQGKDVKKTVDPNYFIFKPNQETICILDQDSAKIREKDMCV